MRAMQICPRKKGGQGTTEGDLGGIFCSTWVWGSSGSPQHCPGSHPAIRRLRSRDEPWVFLNYLWLSEPSCRSQQGPVGSRLPPKQFPQAEPPARFRCGLQTPSHPENPRSQQEWAGLLSWRRFPLMREMAGGHLAEEAPIPLFCHFPGFASGI